MNNADQQFSNGYEIIPLNATGRNVKLTVFAKVVFVKTEDGHYLTRFDLSSDNITRLLRGPIEVLPGIQLTIRERKK